MLLRETMAKAEEVAGRYPRLRARLETPAAGCTAGHGRTPRR
ncbi:hypothetical protein OG607_45405 [Streptomyces sp. NBC_01537]